MAHTSTIQISQTGLDRLYSHDLSASDPGRPRLMSTGGAGSELRAQTPPCYRQRGGEGGHVPAACCPLQARVTSPSWLPALGLGTGARPLPPPRAWLCPRAPGRDLHTHTPCAHRHAGKADCAIICLYLLLFHGHFLLMNHHFHFCP